MRRAEIVEGKILGDTRERCRQWPSAERSQRRAEVRPSLTIRPARISDAGQIVHLIELFAKRGIMLPRSYGEIVENIRDFVVLTGGERILGCCSLHVVCEDTAEIRSLAVAEEAAGQGYGRALIQRLLEDARRLGLPRVFTLTYQRSFFEKLGFYEVDRKELPHKFWRDCFKCLKFAYCDEIAMVKEF